MAKQAKFTVKRRADGAWYVEVPASISPTGKRQRHFYTTRDKANDAAEDLREKHRTHGTGAHVLSPSKIEEYLKASKLLEPWNLSVGEAVRLYVERLRETSSSKHFGDVCALYVQSKATRRESTLASISSMVRALEPLAGQPMAEITGAEVQAILAKFAPSTANLHRRNIGALWRWAAHPSRGWCKADALHLEKAETQHGGEIEVLSPGEVENLLRTAEKYFPDLLPAYALAIFAGVRRDEVKRMSWADIREDGIEVRAETSKKTLRRVIPWNPSLQAWIPITGGNELIVPGAFRDRDNACRRLAGWKVYSRLFHFNSEWKDVALPPLAKDARPWPANAMRHTHASASIANGASATDLVFAFGHAGGIDILRRHYVGRYSKKDALAFWSIAPKGQKIPMMAIAE